MALSQATEPILRVANQTKTFGTFTANEDISFDLRPGEILCLLGENGAGKSTLCNCLFGAYKPDAGQYFIGGKPVRLNSPRDAIKWRIGMVHQHFVLVPPMTVLENIIVGVETGGFFLDRESARKNISGLCTRYGLNIDLDSLVADLSVGQQQWVEILKSLYCGVDILILDEPTAVLTPQETDRLLSSLRQMAAGGISIILITHKLQEVMEVSDRVTILRKGKVVATCDTADMDKASLARLMVGREVSFEIDKKAARPGAQVLCVEGITLRDLNGKKALDDFSLELRSGEILGIAGVSGNGQGELFDALVGVAMPERGRILIKGDDITHSSIARRSNMGLAFVPPDRIKQGLLMGCSLAENFILGFHWEDRFKTCKLFSNKKLEHHARESICEFDIACTGPGQTAAELSGGNLQKVILARELSQDVNCVVASSPTRGLDIGAIEYVHGLLMELRNHGAGVLLISEDLDEVLKLSDRVAVIHGGRIMGAFDAGAANREEIGLLMAGIKGEAK